MRSVAEELAEPLTFFNMSIRSGSIPRAWKRSNVSPIHKGGSCDDPGNFRPISVVPIIAKVLEKLIANQLLSYFESHHLLHDHQGAYRCGRSSDQILLYSIDMIVSALDNGLAVCAAFLDLRKAFDSLDHSILLERLHQLGVCDVELRWFCDYLSDRLQRVKCGDSYSEWGSVLGGIPQGSALGPLLFLVYVNDMPLQVKDGDLVQFADDTCIICSGKTHKEVSEMLCSDLCSLSSWIRGSHMEINVKKSSIMWFNVRSIKGFKSPPISLNGSPLSQVSTHKYLGVQIDEHLKWISHVSYLCKKMAYYLYLISYHHKALPTSILKLLVESLVLSHLNYALPVWGPSLAHDLLTRLVKMYNRAIRVIGGLKKFDHVSSFRRQLNWLSIDSLIQHRCNAVMYKYYTSDRNNCILLNPPIQFGRQSIYSTRTRPYFAANHRFKLSFSQKFFRSKGVYWWNSLPHELLERSTSYGLFKRHLYGHLLSPS